MGQMSSKSLASSKAVVSPSTKLPATLREYYPVLKAMAPNLLAAIELLPQDSPKLRRIETILLHYKMGFEAGEASDLAEVGKEIQLVFKLANADTLHAMHHVAIAQQEKGQCMRHMSTDLRAVNIAAMKSRENMHMATLCKEEKVERMHTSTATKLQHSTNKLESIKQVKESKENKQKQRIEKKVQTNSKLMKLRIKENDSERKHELEKLRLRLDHEYRLAKLGGGSPPLHCRQNGGEENNGGAIEQLAIDEIGHEIISGHED